MLLKQRDISLASFVQIKIYKQLFVCNANNAIMSQFIEQVCLLERPEKMGHISHSSRVLTNQTLLNSYIHFPISSAILYLFQILNKEYE